ncbi:MAG TPA: hypothetical protein PK668_07100 [Myxococcota bacterium]|nr:hypothetical protein [Myxococcota bacterium]HRY92388.1 hypothetical protein [Myxococcota bacterium]HSA24391.1 hypothetical protein [Myxococcota bacterium]
MFEARTDIRFIQTRREWIVAIIEAINAPIVAAPGRQAEAAKAWIVGVLNATQRFSIYVYLLFPESNESLVFLHDPPEVTKESYHDTELEALQFVESMGFMVDNINFRSLAVEAQAQLLQSLPCFQADLKAWARAQQAAQPGAEAPADPDLTPLEGEVLELEEVAEEIPPAPATPPTPVLSPEGVAKIARVLSSF